MSTSQPTLDRQTILLLITRAPSHPLSAHALRYAQTLLEQINSEASDQGGIDKTMKVFFYAEAAHIANGLRWQTADQPNITEGWQRLAQQYNLSLPVCVSTALARGITDADNARRHKLGSRLSNADECFNNETSASVEPSNLAPHFNLVGLGELTTLMSEADRVIQF